MKHKSNIKSRGFSNTGVSVSASNELPPERFRPLSFFMLGGVDLTGRELETSAPVEFDTEEQLSELTAAGFSAAPFGDPRESKFTLVEKYGAFEAEKISSKSGSASKTDSDKASAE